MSEFKRSCHLIVPNNVKKKLYMDFKKGCINIPYCQKIIDRLLQENPVDKNGKVIQKSENLKFLIDRTSLGKIELIKETIGSDQKVLKAL